MPSPSAAAIAADTLDPPPHPYEDNYEGFIRDELRTHLWSKQQEIISSVVKHQRTAVPACFSSSKSFTAARVAAAWMELHPPGAAKIVTTAATFRQVRSILWPEIRLAHSIGGLRGRVNQTEWHLKVDGIENIYGQGLSARDSVAFHGSHAEYVLVILDEADGVPPDIWDAAEGLITTPEDRLLAIGNPWNPAGPFADACKPNSGFNVVRISAYEAPSFTGEEVPERLHRLLVSKQWVKDKEKRWGKKDPRFISKVLARFPGAVRGTLLHLVWVEEAQTRKIRKTLPIEIGADIAEGVERDETVIVVRRGSWARVIHASRTTGVAEATGVIKRAIDDTGATVAKVDAVGIGAGVVSNLRAMDYPVIGVKNQQRAHDPENYRDAGAEMYGGLMARFEDGDADIDPDDDEMAGQLISVRGTYNQRGQLVLESKDSRRRRGLPSPDRADALALSFYPVSSEELTAASVFDTGKGSGKTLTGDLMDAGF